MYSSMGNVRNIFFEVCRVSGFGGVSCFFTQSKHTRCKWNGELYNRELNSVPFGATWMQGVPSARNMQHIDMLQRLSGQ